MLIDANVSTNHSGENIDRDRRCCASDGYNTKDIRLNWAPNCVQGFGDVELPQFRVTGWNCTRLIANFSSGLKC